MMALMYILVIYLVITGFFTPVMLIVLLALTLMPGVWRMYRKPYPQERPADFPAKAWPTYFAAAAFMHNRRYGLLFILGLLVDAMLHVLKVAETGLRGTPDERTLLRPNGHPASPVSTPLPRSSRSPR